jgi:hypothetical protein
MRVSIFKESPRLNPQMTRFAIFTTDLDTQVIGNYFLTKKTKKTKKTKE